MNLANTSLVDNVSASDPPASPPGNVASLGLKKAVSLQAEVVAELLASVVQSAAPLQNLASSGAVGTQLNTYA